MRGCDQLVGGPIAGHPRKLLGIGLCSAAKYTDSQSLLKAIQSGSADTPDLRRMLDQRIGMTAMLRIPGHHGITVNEEAGACAMQAAAVSIGVPRPCCCLDMAPRALREGFS